ncbi:hypothetical protein SGGMMB4_01847 [Sodalis glossinidius str. 'morsitans']|uniref:Uncharacterized protein n=1 Tax=Sodalis glossinidius (strain morsitans) TaxID=343509 RepID=A0A193QHN7_SODGM|nr:hypothetical protein SGGMMB4_01847 [Sodalis glossinidius str. 'morsitans']
MLYRAIKCEYWYNGNRCVYYLNDRSIVQESRLVPMPFSLRFYDARQRIIYSDAIRQQMKQAVMRYKKQH